MYCVGEQRTRQSKEKTHTRRWTNSVPRKHRQQQHLQHYCWRHNHNTSHRGTEPNQDETTLPPTTPSPLSEEGGKTTSPQLLFGLVIQVPDAAIKVQIKVLNPHSQSRESAKEGRPGPSTTRSTPRTPHTREKGQLPSKDRRNGHRGRNSCSLGPNR